MKTIILAFFAMCCFSHALEIELPFEHLRLDATTQHQRGFTSLYSVFNVDLGDSVLVSLQSNSQNAPPPQSHCPPAEIFVADSSDQTILRVPLLLSKGHASLILKKELWQDATLNIYVNRKHLANHSPKDKVLAVDISSYPIVSRRDFFANPEAYSHPQAPPAAKKFLIGYLPGCLIVILLASFLIYRFKIQRRHNKAIQVIAAERGKT